MTKYVFRNIRSCTESKTCHADTKARLEADFGIKFGADTSTSDVAGHISINHKGGDHKYWVFIYDTDGIHEGATHGTDETVFTPSSRVKATLKTKPTLDQVKLSA